MPSSASCPQAAQRRGDGVHAVAEVKARIVERAIDLANEGHRGQGKAAKEYLCEPILDFMHASMFGLLHLRLLKRSCHVS